MYNVYGMGTGQIEGEGGERRKLENEMGVMEWFKMDRLNSLHFSVIGRVTLLVASTFSYQTNLHLRKTLWRLNWNCYANIKLELRQLKPRTAAILRLNKKRKH